MKRTLLGLASFLVLAGRAAGQPSPGPQPLPPQPPIPAPRDVAYPGVIRLRVDATDLDRRIFRVRETVPLTGPGPVTLLYPLWLPGDHSPYKYITWIR